MNSHDSQNPIKQKDMDLKILGRMILDPKNGLEHKNYENNLIIKVKNKKHLKGEKGHLEGEKGIQG